MHPSRNPEIERRNLELIRSLYPSYAEILSSIHPETAPYKIESISSDAFACQKKGPDGGAHWLHGPDNPWQWAESQIRQVNWDAQRTFLVLRPGLGYVPFTLYPRLRKGRTAQRMLLVEDRADLFRLSLMLFDWTDLLRSDRTIFILTDRLPETALQFFTQNPVAILPPMSVMCGCVWGDEERKLMSALQPKIQEMAKTVNGAARQYIGELHQHYRSAALSPERKKKVVMVEPEHDYLANPIAQAFEEEGWSVEKFKGNRRLLRFLNPYVWLLYTREHFPDLLLWMNRNTLSPEGAQELRPLPVQKILWFLDSPKRVQTSREELTATDAYFSFDHTYLPYLKEISDKEGFPLSTAAGIRPRPECEPGKQWPEREGPDIGFMGALGADRFQDVRWFWRRRDPDFVKILDRIVEEYLADPSRTLEERYQDSPGRERLPYSGFVVLYLEERSTYLRRLRTLKRLCDFGLATYGAKEWSNPEWAEELAFCYSHEQPSYETDLPKVYFHTRINVNIFHAQCVDSTNPRVYDVLAAGGFLLTEYRPQIEKEFLIGEHLDCFRSPEEARQKANFYLEHPEKREEIARAGQEFVLNHATYRHRIREMLSRIPCK